jgi:hypothetical protein
MREEREEREIREREREREREVSLAAGFALPSLIRLQNCRV